MENPIQMDDLGVPLFQETSMCAGPLHFTHFYIPSRNKVKQSTITTATSPAHLTKHLRLHWHLHRRPDGRQVVGHARTGSTGPDGRGVRWGHGALHGARHGRRMHIGLEGPPGAGKMVSSVASDGIAS